MKLLQNFFLFLVISIIFHETCLVNGELIQVQIIHRHGARSHLSKHGLKPGLENGAQLLPLGVSQLKTLGNLIRTRYLEGTSTTSTTITTKLENGRLNYSSPLDVISISTNLDRTLTSARAFLKGLYPDQYELIPTKVFGAKENDYRLRGYAICPTMNELPNIDGWFSRTFKKHEKFIQRIAPAVNEKPTVNNLFNIYDKYKLISLGIPTSTGTKALSPSDWNKLKQVTDSIETKRYNGFHKVPQPQGKSLLATLMSYSNEIAKNYNNPNSRTHRIIEYSAHYPTLLSLLQAIRPTNPNPLPPADTIPEFSAALLWETHRSKEGKFFIRTLWYDGESAQPTEYNLFRCTKCTLTELLHHYKDLSTEPAAFCKPCETNPATSPICFDGALPSHINDNGQITNAPWFHACRSTRISSILTGAALGIGFVLLIFVIARAIGMWRMRRERSRLARINSLANSSENDPGWSGMNKASPSASTGPSSIE